jgi:hypothetical protein
MAAADLQGLNGSRATVLTHWYLHKSAKLLLDDVTRCAYAKLDEGTRKQEFFLTGTQRNRAKSAVTPALAFPAASNCHHT